MIQLVSIEVIADIFNGFLINNSLELIIGVDSSIHFDLGIAVRAVLGNILQHNH
jgi:hypothetical protein